MQNEDLKDFVLFSIRLHVVTVLQLEKEDTERE